MRAFISIKYHEDHSNRALITQISSALESKGYHTICVIRDIELWGAIHYDPKVLMEKTFEAINESAIVIVDLTEKGG